ncbi:MAG TPA: hypothetical protein VN428_06215 [Bryobacteraceae bacterium]|nr:hypothetical protein [Bryobacteraceae bacterium]
MRIRRQVVGRHGEAESTLVYEREAAAVPVNNAVSPPSNSPKTRFGRRVFKPAEPGYVYTKIDGFDTPTQTSKDAFVSCLAYGDPARIYVEVGIRSQADRALTIAADFIGLEQAGRPIHRTPTLRASEEIHTGALRPFMPVPTGKHPQTGEALYDRSSVDQQTKRHLELQEQESTFASVLLAMGQTGATILQPRQERTVLCTFEQRHDRSAPFSVTVRLGEDVFRFTFIE